MSMAVERKYVAYATFKTLVALDIAGRMGHVSKIMMKTTSIQWKPMRAHVLGRASAIQTNQKHGIGSVPPSVQQCSHVMASVKNANMEPWQGRNPFP